MLLKQLGFSRVINRNVDFYKEISKGKTPNCDVLVTNPPYSGTHKQQLLEFLVSPPARDTPFALLLPVYIATKSYWRAFSANCSEARPGQSVQYLLPKASYEYCHPEGTGKDIPPFYR